MPDESYLRSAGFGDDVARHGESRLKNLLRIVDGRLEQLGEVFILGLVLIAGEDTG